MAESELKQWPETVVVRYFERPGAALMRPETRAEWEAQMQLTDAHAKLLPVQQIMRGFAIFAEPTNAVLAQGLTWNELVRWMNRDVAHYWVRDRQADEHREPVRWDRVDRAFWRVEGPAHPPSLVGITAQLSIPARQKVHVAQLSWMGAHCQLTIHAASWAVFFDQESWFTTLLAIGEEKLTPEQFEAALERNYYVRRGE